MLADLFPSSKLVFLLRDGRDVVDSWLAAYQNGSWQSAAGPFPVAPEGRVPLIRWLGSVWAYRTEAVLEAFRSRRPGDRILVRYEELLERPGEKLEEICATLAIDPPAAPAVASRHSFERLPADSRGPLCETRAAAPGGWRENLSVEEQEALHEALGEVLAKVGYRPELPPVAA